MQERVLVVEDDASLLDVLTIGLELHGFEVARAEGVSRAILEIQKSQPSVVLADYQLRDGTAFDLLAWLKARDLRIPLIVLTGQARIDLAVEAIKHGAEQFVPKPVDIELLTTMLRRSLENFRNLQKSVSNRLERARYDRDPFIGTSAAIVALKKAAQRVAEASGTVLIQGDTGTGKGVLARALHRMGPRANEPFVDLNCAGLSRELLESELFGHQKGAFTGAVANKMGFLEAAHHGTLFLDEIGDMDLDIQAKILKVVEEKRFYRLGDVVERKADVQIIVATHRDLKRLADEGKFRTDLYFRINTLRLRIPPLRERPGDAILLARFFLSRFNRELNRSLRGFTEAAVAAIGAHSWPGNVRELENRVKRAVVMADGRLIDAPDLELVSPQGEAPDFDLRGARLRAEREVLQRALSHSNNRLSATAKLMGVSRPTLYGLLESHDLMPVRASAAAGEEDDD